MIEDAIIGAIMTLERPVFVVGLLITLGWLAAGARAVPAFGDGPDLVVVTADGWTGDPERPRASRVAVEGDRIIAVSAGDGTADPDTASVRRYPSGFLLPGLIDNHTHFNRAGALLLGVNLLEAADEDGFVAAVESAHERLPTGSWMVGGDWGAYAAWERGSTGADEGVASGADQGATASAPFAPDRRLIDPVLGARPALLSRWDGEVFLANGAALEAAGADCGWPGVECDAEGRMNGRLDATAAARIRKAIPAPTFDQRIAEAELALERLAGFGVTTIHDITPAEQMRVFQNLRDADRLTVRVYARPTLDTWESLAHAGIVHGFGDDWLKIGGLKGFVDGIMGNSSARFYEPYLTSGERGRWRDMMRPEGNMRDLLLGADRAGHWPQVHAIGDEAIDTLLDLYADVVKTNPPRERRFRVIHTQVIRGPAVARRMAEMDVIAEVQPYHAIDDMRWMAERIGDRSRWAYAFRTLHEAGVRLSFGSDWPGTNASWYPSNPLLGIYAAVTRQTLEGEPAEGWYPEERVDVETALRAYTVNNAWAAGEEAEKGSLTPGRLADFVVLDRDPFAIPVSELKDVKVLLTVVGGRIVFER